MVRYDRIHFILFQNIFCMKNWGKINLFRKTCKFGLFLYTLNDTFIVNFSSPRTVFFIITEQGVHYHWMMYFLIVVVSAWVDPTKVNIKIIISWHLYWLFSWIFIKEAPWLDLNVQRSQTTIAQGPLSYFFQDNHTCEVCHSPLRLPHIMLTIQAASSGPPVKYFWWIRWVQFLWYAFHWKWIPCRMSRCRNIVSSSKNASILCTT